MYCYKLKCRDYPVPELDLGYKILPLQSDNETINKKYNIIKKRVNKGNNRIPRNEILHKKLSSIIYEMKSELMENVSANSLQNKTAIKNAKHSIDKYYSDFSWDKMKLYTNPYEFIFLSSNKFLQTKGSSVAKVEPLSRSFFKMIEISNNYFQDEINRKEPNRSLHLAEGPGGFIEALVYLRKKRVSRELQKEDMYYGITLLDKAYEVPSWKKSGLFMKENLNVNILTGVDGIGDLCNTDNLWFLYQRFKHNKMDIITGDGGFDFSVDYNLQEYVAFPLILSQCIAGLSCLKKGGKYMCKIFDMNTIITVELLYILQCYFDEISFFKPKTSRLANSEKYIICTGFKGINYEGIKNLISILETWNNIDVDNCSYINSFVSKKTNFSYQSKDNNKEVKREVKREVKMEIKKESNSENTILENTILENPNSEIRILNYLFFSRMVYGEGEKEINKYKVPISFFNYINKINTEIIENQIKNIELTIEKIKEINIKKINHKWFEDRQIEQVKNAIQWCKENGIPY